MDSMQQDAYFRQRVVRYAQKHGVCEAARKYHISRKSAGRWLKRYDKNVTSLLERTSRPHSHPRQHTPEEDALVLRVQRHNKKMSLEMIYEEISGTNAVEFLKKMLVFFPFPIACIQTDNGSEFTNRFHSDKPGAFDIALDHLGITHKLIRVATPRHNGKVERSHRTDQHFFYDDHRFFSLADDNAQLATHLRWCNRFLAVAAYTY